MKNIRSLSLLIAMALALCLAGCGAASSTPASSAPAASASASSAADEAVVNAVFTVVYEDGASKEFALQCAEGDTLAAALEKAGLISADEAASGFVTVVDGVASKFDEDQSWWQLMDGAGLPALKGICDIVLAEGDSYSFAYTIGY